MALDKAKIPVWFVFILHLHCKFKGNEFLTIEIPFKSSGKILKDG